jgi:pilus assembly protein CpaE
VRTLVISDDAKQLDTIRRLLAGLDGVGETVAWSGTLAGHSALPAKGEVDLLLLDAGRDPQAALAELERLMPLYPKLEVVLVGGADSPDVLRRALRLGVREVVHGPAARDELVEALGRLTVRGQAGSGERGKVLSFLSCKGGSGATFLATNLGYALAALEGKSVLLIDLNLQFGDAALFVSDRWPQVTLADVARDVGRIDRAYLQAAAVPVLHNFGVLAASEDPTRAADVRAEHVDALIRFARTQVDYVLLDLGRSLDPVSVRALDMSDAIFPVVQLMLPYARDGRRMLDVFRSLGYGNDKVRPLVNRAEKGAALTQDDLERALRAKVYGSIPNHFQSVNDSVNQGLPICKLSRGSPVARSLAQLARQVVGQPDATADRWLGRLFSRG